MKKELVAKVTRQITKIQSFGKKNAPELLIVGSIAGIASGVVLACRATVKSIPVLEEAKEELHEIKNFITKNDFFLPVVITLFVYLLFVYS